VATTNHEPPTTNTIRLAVIGTGSDRAFEIMKLIYEPFVRNENPIIRMDRRSAEMTKYASNAMLATKISFINEMADLAERVGADVHAVAKGMGLDQRIGAKFLQEYRREIDITFDRTIK
jgi:UDPglucose 6-dehydrogenase